MRTLKTWRTLSRVRLCDKYATQKLHREKTWNWCAVHMVSMAVAVDRTSGCLSSRNLEVTTLFE
jgi:hypothetical protein